MKNVTLPLEQKVLRELKAGQKLLLSGPLYTARDEVHRILFNIIRNGRKPPFPLRGCTLYYAGPTPAPPHRVIGACGPTTSARMDRYTPALLKAGVRAMIGKGRRGSHVKDAIKKYQAVYFLAPAGCGALLSERIYSCRLVAYRHLGPEAVYELTVKDFPVIVGVDSKGDSIYR